MTGRITRITLIMHYEFWMYYLYGLRSPARGCGLFPLSLVLIPTWGNPALFSLHCLISTYKSENLSPLPPEALIAPPLHHPGQIQCRGGTLGWAAEPSKHIIWSRLWIYVIRKRGEKACLYVWCLHFAKHIVGGICNKKGHNRYVVDRGTKIDIDTL